MSNIGSIIQIFLWQETDWEIHQLPLPIKSLSCSCVTPSLMPPTTPATWRMLCSNSCSTIFSSSSLSSTAPWVPFLDCVCARCSCSNRLLWTPVMCTSISPRFFSNFFIISSISSAVLEKKLIRSPLLCESSEVPVPPAVGWLRVDHNPA